MSEPAACGLAGTGAVALANVAVIIAALFLDSARSNISEASVELRAEQTLEVA